MKVDGSRPKTSKTAEYLKFIYKYVYICGWPNFWQTRLDLPPIFHKYHDILSLFLNACCVFFVVIELGGLITQNDLTDKQKSDGQLFAFGHFFIGSYGFILMFYQKNVRAMTYTLAIELKKWYNDENIEVDMIKKGRRYSIAYCTFAICSLVLYGVDGMMRVFFKDGTFITVITVWPDANDHSSFAGYFRVLSYILFWIFMIRTSTIIVMFISTIVCLEHQYKNLQSYFYNLDNLFQNDKMMLKDKEEKYENGLKLGIKMHDRTLWCTRECEESYAKVVSGQILVNIGIIILLLSQMLNSERTFASVGATLSTMTATLVSTGCFMWNAGDLTVEAAALSEAMFNSGWQNCQGDASVRVRKLLVIAMTQAQVPVSIRAFGVIKLSYESYVSIVKSSYSIFSVLY